MKTLFIGLVFFVVFVPVTLGSIIWLPRDSASKFQQSELTPKLLPGPSGHTLPAHDRNEQQPSVEADSAAHAIPAVVVALQQAPVRVAVSGMVASLDVSEGGQVQAGQRLAAIDETEINSRIAEQVELISASDDLVAQAEAELIFAKQDLQLYHELHKRLAAASIDLSEREYRHKSTVSRLSALKHEAAQRRHEHASLLAHRSRHQVFAPFAGTVTKVLGFPNQFIAEGDVVLWLESSTRQLKLHVPQTLASEKDGLRFSMFVKHWHELEIANWQPRFNADGSQTLLLTIPAEIELLPGQIVKVNVEREEPAS